MHLSSGDLWHQLRQPLASSCAAARSSAELDFGSQWVPMVIPSQVTRFGGMWGPFPSSGESCQRLPEVAGAGANRIPTRVNRITACVFVITRYLNSCFFSSFVFCFLFEKRENSIQDKLQLGSEARSNHPVPVARRNGVLS